MKYEGTQEESHSVFAPGAVLRTKDDIEFINGLNKSNKRFLAGNFSFKGLKSMYLSYTVTIYILSCSF